MKSIKEIFFILSIFISGSLSYCPMTFQPFTLLQEGVKPAFYKGNFQDVYDNHPEITNFKIYKDEACNEVLADFVFNPASDFLEAEISINGVFQWCKIQDRPRASHKVNGVEFSVFDIVIPDGEENGKRFVKIIYTIISKNNSF